MKPLCAHAGRSNAGLDRRKGVVRTCALGIAGGLVSRKLHCELCPKHEPAKTPPREKKVEELSANTLRKIALAVIAPCVHEGAPSRPPDGKPTSKKWFACDHPDQPLGSPTCRCKGCGPRCSGYEADGDVESPESSGTGAA